MSIWRTIGKLFRRNKVSVYVAMGDVTYTRVAGQLQNSGIPFYVKMGGAMSGGEYGYDGRLAEYEIYVKREYEEQARSLLGTSDFA